MSRGTAFGDSLIGTKVGGRYVVDKLLGSGGMGIVASAKHPDLGTRVAIKFLRPEHADDDVVKQRFLREGRVAARVKSSHFVRVVDVGTLDSGVPYLVMEMLAGRDLSDELRARGPLPVADAVDIVLQACTGLAELHALGVVHRDLKPSNLFVNEAAGSKVIKVLDFGISKEQRRTDAKDNPLTSTDHVLGTPQYMSPEQIKASKDVDPRSDVWSLGVILYELLTQRLPFVAEGPGVGELFARILYFDPEKPSVHRADLPPDLEAVIMKCLTRELAERYADVAALAEALRPFAGAKSVHRIDAVHEALSTPTPHVEESMPPPADKAINLAATVPVGQGKKTPDPESIHASSVELAAIPKKRSTARTIALVAAACAIAFAIAFARARSGTETQEASAPAAVAPDPTPTPSLAASPSEAPSPSVAPSESAPASLATTSASPAVAARPPTVPVVKTAAPRPPPSAKPKPTSDPILDRK